MKIGNLIRLETMWSCPSDPKWFYGIVMDKTETDAEIYWFDDGNKTWESFSDLEVIV